MDSDRPTLRPMQTRIKKAVSFLELGKALAAVLSAAGTASAAIWASYSWFTTDQELLEHDLREEAHPALIRQIKELQEQLLKQQAAIDDCRAGATVSLKYQVRERAAARERQPEIRKLAADFYEEEFDALVRKGAKLDDAFLESLRATWYDRPRVR